MTKSIGLLLVAFAALSGCRRSESESAPPARQNAERAPPAAAAPAPPVERVGWVGRRSGLPEDPVLGAKSTAEWREHLAHEEDERQLGFDRRHLAEHRAVVSRFRAARSRYDGVRSAARVSAAATDVARQVDAIHARITKLDPWGVNSRLLGDYAALEALLRRVYRDAKLAQLNGDPRPLKTAAKSFDDHLNTISDWLERAAEEEEE